MICMCDCINGFVCGFDFGTVNITHSLHSFATTGAWHPPKRFQELRAYGPDIMTVWGVNLAVYWAFAGTGRLLCLCRPPTASRQQSCGQGPPSSSTSPGSQDHPSGRSVLLLPFRSKEHCVLSTVARPAMQCQPHTSAPNLFPKRQFTPST